MPLPRTSLDPHAYYAWLGVEPSASRASIVAAFRAKARLLHPDVPATGNAEAFVALKQAYDVLGNPQRRAEYDRKAREAAERPRPFRPEAVVVRPTVWQESVPVQPLPLPGAPVAVWIALGAFLCLCVWQATSHFMAQPKVATAGVPPNAATVEPLPVRDQKAVLYGPAPVRLAGTPNFYVTPGAGPAVLFRHDAERNVFVPVAQLPPFSEVQAVRIIRQTGMLEVLVNDQLHGFIGASRLTPGDAHSARLAYCGFNSGPVPHDGELLERQGSGTGTLAVENRAMQPIVVKLRNEAGAVTLAVFLAPGGHVELDGLPDDVFHPEFAIGELWSRGCNIFAAGMRARRMDEAVRLPARIVVADDGEEPAATDITEQAFGRD